MADESLGTQRVGTEGALAASSSIQVLRQELIQIANWVSVSKLSLSFKEETDLRVAELHKPRFTAAI